MAEDLAKYKLQHQQVEAALLGDPSNEELKKLKVDLEEMIAIQDELVEAEKQEADSKDKVPQQVRLWKVGDRVMAPNISGNKGVAVIDSCTAAGYAITFVATGQKTIVNPDDLVPAPDAPGGRKIVFDKKKHGAARQEWQAERERRRMRAAKKEARKKELDSGYEAEKQDWKKFNMKAQKKGLSGLKKVSATGSANDTGARKESFVSSRSNDFSFKSTRGNMDSMF